MKAERLLLLMAFTGIVVLLKAQPTLTYNNNAPQVGETFQFHFVDVSGTAAGSAGMGQTWNFSSSISANVLNLNYVAPGTTPAASSFPSANVALAQAGTYDYYQSGTTSHARLGAYNGSQTIVYSDPQIHMAYPMAYGTMYTDSFAGTMSGSFPVQRRGTITGEVDGYGTLITPQGTFQNVLRIKYVEDYQDEFNGTPVTFYDSEIFIWYTPGTHSPLFSITKLTVSNGGTSYYGGYLDATSVSGEKPLTRENTMSMFPNPASEVVTLNTEFTRPGKVEIHLRSVTGQEIRTVDAGVAAPGTFSQRMDVSDLAPGMYLVRLQCGEQSRTSKLVVR